MEHSLENYLRRLPTQTLKMLLDGCTGDPLDSYVLPLISRILQEHSDKAASQESASCINN